MGIGTGLLVLALCAVVDPPVETEGRPPTFTPMLQDVYSVEGVTIDSNRVFTPPPTPRFPVPIPDPASLFTNAELERARGTIRVERSVVSSSAPLHPDPRWGDEPRGLFTLWASIGARYPYIIPTIQLSITDRLWNPERRVVDAPRQLVWAKLSTWLSRGATATVTLTGGVRYLAIRIPASPLPWGLQIWAVVPRQEVSEELPCG